MNLAVILELPLVVLDVQRGGPATGLPTKSEQTDLLQALYGRTAKLRCPFWLPPLPPTVLMPLSTPQKSLSNI